MKTIGYNLLAMLMLFAFSACQNGHQRKQNKESEPGTPVLLSNPHNEASCVYLTADQNGIPVVSWVEIDSTQYIHYYFAKLDTATGKFQHKTAIPVEQKASIHGEGMPKIAVKGDGSLFVLYGTSIPYKNRKWGLGDLRYIQSFDGGKTWTNPKSVDPKGVAKGLSTGFANLIRLGNGEIGITFLGSKPHMPHMHKGESRAHMHHMDMSGRPVKFVATKGKTGLGNILTVDKNACQCCQTAISSTKQGLVAVVYRDLLPGSVRDISVSFSYNNGKSFSKPVSFSNDHWVLDGCPHAGPSVSTAQGHIYVSWYTGSQTHNGANFVQLDTTGHVLNREHLSRNAHYIQVSQLPDGTPIAVYNEIYHKGDSTYTKIMASTIRDNRLYAEEITAPKVQATFPVVQSMRHKKAVTAWSTNGKVKYSIVSTKAIKKPLERLPELVSVE